MHASRSVRSLSIVSTVVVAAAFAALAPPPSGAAVETVEAAQTGRELYMAACANCHGADGRGVSKSRVGFDVPLPDFTDCNFATREPDPDWVAVAHEGGPTRGFSEMMPAFGGVLSVDQLQRIMDHVRTFCPDHAWPRGELNLPRALVTEKAYPEDEAVLTTAVPSDDRDAVDGEIVYEQRFGARNQFELVVPFGWRKTSEGGVGGDEWTSAVGDVALGVKRAVYHDVDRGSILSVTGEVILPTGDEDRGLGKGTTVFEPFVSYGQILPAELFLHSQAGVELPLDTDKAEQEAFVRCALGRTFTSGPWGRAWSPMIEVLGARELDGGADTNWDVVPQMQVTLNTRQHVMMNIGVRTPVNNTKGRDTQVIIYILWDWFDGGFLEGW